MESKECMISIIQRQTEGVVYHENMTDYYRFLCIDGMKKIHCCQSKKELKCLCHLKDDFSNIYLSLPYFSMDNISLIPKDWYNKTSLEINKGSLSSLAKEGMYHWLEWEKSTLEFYRNCAKIFKENMSFYELKIVNKLIKKVSEEIYEIEDLITDGLSYDFSPEYLKYYFKSEEEE